jgi:4-amino-4-deoxy-L-arabinose transferase-like glycosyltransferase
MSRKKSKTLRSNKRAQQPPKAPRKLEGFEKWAGPGLIVIVFCVLAFWSWRKWPDLLVDFGQQLYIPWQLASGKLLYKDIVILHGPLSQYFNAFWFKVFGPSLTVLIFVNLAILAGITVVLRKSVRRFTDSLTATVVCLVLLTLFGFSQYVRVGNYNYVTPYTHETTHGVALTVAMILALSHYLTRGGRVAGAVSGLCLGLVLLTKVEVALAAAAVAVIGFAMAYFVGPQSTAPKRDGLVLFCGMALAPALGFYLYFLSHLPAEQALHAVGQGFFIPSGKVGKSVFFMRILGLDNPGDNLSQMLKMFVAVVTFVLGAVTADVVCRKVTKNTRLAAIVLGLVFLLALYLGFHLLPWLDIPRALPLTTSLALAVFVVLLVKHPCRMEWWPALLPMVLWTTFALSLLSKMALNVRIYHYGFYLAMPATLVLVICLVYWIPEVLRRTRGCGVVFRTLALAILAAASLYYLNRSHKLYQLKDFAVGNGGDTIFTYGPKLQTAGLVTSQTLEWIAEKTSPEATFVGLPEGIMLNYLSRRTTTSSYVNFTVGEMLVFGEKRFFDDLKVRPPDYVILVDKDTAEFGVGPFGADPRYGQQIMDWVNRQYTPVTLVGDEPLQGRDFGIKILKRNNP